MVYRCMMSIGVLATSHLHETGSPTSVYLIFACLVGVLSVLAFFFPEKRYSHATTSCSSAIDILKLTLTTLCRRPIAYPILFALILSATPSTGQAFDYFLINELLFEPRFIGYLSVVASVSMLLAIAAFAYVARNDKFNMRCLFLCFTIAAGLYICSICSSFSVSVCVCVELSLSAYGRHCICV